MRRVVASWAAELHGSRTRKEILNRIDPRRCILPLITISLTLGSAPERIRRMRTMRTAAQHLISALVFLSVFASAQNSSGKASAPEQINEIMQARYAAGDFSGTVLVARQGKVVFQRGFGMANREWNIPNDLETKFEIG